MHDPRNVSRRVAPFFTVPLTPLANGNHDEGYLAWVNVGTNPTPYRVLVDSGSSDFWLIRDTCPQRGLRLPVGPSISQTLRPVPGDSWMSQYEDGSSVSGFIVADNVAIDGLVLRGYPFGAGDMLIGTPATSTYDGIMGFGFSSSSQTRSTTILDTLAHTSLIPKRISGWKLSRNLDGRLDGELTFGGENTARFFQDKQVFVQNLPGGSKKDWRFSIDGISMDGSQVMSARVGIVDTGTSVMLVDPFDAYTIHSKISGAVSLSDNSYAIPCSAQPKLSITINDSPFDVDPRDIVGDLVSADLCHSNIVPDRWRASGEWLLGIAFLKNVYLTLDVTGERIGFAKLR
ncbi:acid protease [Dentipellis sp. KUC8613]|nr:acid protease [Dentipellis sp. KUC8613]